MVKFPRKKDIKARNISITFKLDFNFREVFYDVGDTGLPAYSAGWRIRRTGPPTLHFGGQGTSRLLLVGDEGFEPPTSTM